MSQDPMAGGTTFKPHKFKLGKPGDILKGTLTKKEHKTPTQGDPYTECEVKVEICLYHDLMQDEAGNFVAVAEATEVAPGRMVKFYGGRREIDELIANSNVGDIIGIKFEEFVKGKGPKPFKKVTAKNFGKDPNYMGEDSETVDTAAAAEEAFPTVEE